MYSDNMISLCYVSNQNDKTTELCRIADYHNGSFEPYTYDSTRDFYETERDLLYGYNRDVSGFIGCISVYSWSAYLDSSTGKWRTAIRENEIPWIEVISSSQNTLEQLVEMIKGGIKLSMPMSRKHDIIVCCSVKNSFAEAIYIHANDLVSANDLFTISDSVTFIETSRINYYQDTAPCRCRYNPSDTVRYLLRPDSWKATGKVSVRSRQEIVSSAILSYVRRLNKDGVIRRTERQNFKSVIDKLSSDAISDEVMRKLGCTRDDAVFYIEEYLTGLEKRLEQNEADWIMRRLIENDSEYAQEMYKAVEAQWHEEHATARSEWTAELKKAQDTLAAVQQEISIAQGELTNARSKKEQYEAAVVEALQLQEDIEKSIQRKLASIRTDRAKALVDEAWAMAAATPATISEIKQNHTWFFDNDVKTDPIEEVALAERWMDAVVQWKHICADERRSIEIAAFFLAAYANKQNLIITGEYAELIADAAAEIVTGRNCVKVYVMDHESITDIIREINSIPHDCICFLNGLEQKYDVLRAIMRYFKDSQFIITAPHYESLVMEPASLFTTFLPVCSEEFCMSSTRVGIDSLSCKSDLRSDKYTNPDKQLRSIRTGQAAWFANGFFAPMLVDRCARLHYVIKVLLVAFCPEGEQTAKRTMLSMVYVPLMRCLRRKDILSANLSEFEILDDTLKNRLLGFSGIEKE